MKMTYSRNTQIKYIYIPYLVILIYAITNNAMAFNHSEKFILKHKINNKTLKLESHFTHNENGFSYNHYDAGINIALSHDIKAALHYRIIYSEGNNNWETEKRPYVQLEKTFNTPLLEYRLRTRQEVRIRDETDEVWRNRIRVGIKLNNQKFKPFINNEVFYDFDAEKYNKNWFSIGLILPKVNNLKPTIYYKDVTSLDEENTWSHDPSIVFKLEFIF